jgi:peptide/nickel transport system substrate-binding protein
MIKRLLLVVLSVLSLAAGARAAEPVKNPDTFVFAATGDIDSLDPAWAYDTASHLIIDNIYENLLAYKGSGVKPSDLVPVLAAKMPSVSADGLSYTFPIRKGVTFQDGTPMTPEDVQYSLIRFMLFDRDGGPSSLLLEPLLGVSSTRKDGKIIDGIYDQAANAVTVKGDSVVIKLKRPFAPFLTILATYSQVLSKKWCAANGEWDGRAETFAKHNNPGKDGSYLGGHANGTGPFKLLRIEPKTKEIVLERNDSYWRKPAALKRVIVKVVDEFATRKLMLQAGDADSIYTPQMYAPQIAGLPGVEVKDVANLERSPMVFFTFNINPTANPNLGSGKLDGQGIPPNFFSDVDVRKAFAYSIDYQAYVKDILKGKGRQASSFIPSSMIGAREDKHYSFDPKKAEEHFKKAWGGKVWDQGFKFTVLFNTGSTPAQTICQMLKRNVEAINSKFKVEVRALQWSTFLEQSQAQKLPLYTGAWQADYPDPHNFAYPLLHSTGYFPSKQGYKNPEVDKLIEQAVGTLDVKTREALYFKLQDLFFDDVPHVLVAEGLRCRTQRSWVKGWTFSPVFPDSPYGDYYYNLSKEGK